VAGHCWFLGLANGNAFFLTQFQEYVEGQPETIRYKLFPRKSSNEMLTGPKENMIPFPLEQIEVCSVTEKLLIVFIPSNSNPDLTSRGHRLGSADGGTSRRT
jgi:hypothetical protein